MNGCYGRPVTPDPTALDMLQLILRLGSALLVGSALGINRDLRHKAAGLRTHALVSVGSALAVLVPITMSPLNVDAAARVMQGLLTGIGFLGAGVIIHHERHKRVQGLTTAASLWVSAVLGMACGAGHLVLVGLGVTAVLLVLIAGGPFERAIERRFLKTDDPEPPAP